MQSVVNSTFNKLLYYGSRGALILLYFVFIYSLQFTFIPSGISSRIILGLIGIALLSWDLLQKFAARQAITMPRNFAVILLLMVTLAAVSLFSIAINSTSDYIFISYPISIVLILMGGYTVARATKSLYRKLNFVLISSNIVAATILQMIISLAMFVDPALQQMMLSLLANTDTDSVAAFMEFRILGFGTQFFAAGVSNSFALLLIAALLKERRRYVFLLMISFVLIVSVGMMMARTTLIGAGMAMLYLVFNSQFLRLRISRLMSRIVVSFLSVIFLVGAIFFSLPSETTQKLEVGLEYGFEMFVNYFETGEATTASTDDLAEHYQITPQGTKTWIIGDGYFADPSNEAFYYKGSDLGYIRLIFYFGLIGMFAYLALQLAIVRRAYYACDGRYTLFFIMCGALLLIVLAKGFYDISPLVAIYCFVESPKILKIES